METTETARLLSFLAAAFPPLTLEPDTFEVWHQVALSNVEFVDADRAARWIIRNDQRFPTPAHFLEVLRLVRRANQPVVEAITDGEPVDPETSRRLLAACRRIVRPI